MQLRLSLLAAILAAAASAQVQQSVDQVFYLTHTQTVRDFQQLAMTIRGVSGTEEASHDDAQRSLTLRGTPDQLAVAQWLAQELDLPAESRLADPGASREFAVPGSSGDLVRVFFLPPTESVPFFQNAATVIRSIADIRYLYPTNALRALAVRATADQLALVSWMVQQVNDLTASQPSTTQSQIPDAKEYRMPSGPENVVRVYLLPENSAENVQDEITTIRTIADVRRMFFTFPGPSIVAVRGTSDQIALADWMLHRLDPAASGTASTANPAGEYQVPGPGSENVVRLFAMPPGVTVQGFLQVAKDVRTATGIRRLIAYRPSPTLAVRGTADQIAQADALIRNWLKSQP